MYNHHDVELLRRAAREYRAASMAATGGDKDGMDPLQYLTTPAACLALFRGMDLPERHVPNLSLPMNRIFRRALSGGRVEATLFYWSKFDAPMSERLCKIDINSLYPAVEVKYRYPKGYPQFYYGQPGPGTSASTRWPAGIKTQFESFDDVDIDSCLAQFGVIGTDDDGKDYGDQSQDHCRFSFLVVDVTPPDDLRHPVLPVKEEGKNKYTLEPKTNYAVFSPMLRKACQKGYKVTKVRICHRSCER